MQVLNVSYIDYFKRSFIQKLFVTNVWNLKKNNLYLGVIKQQQYKDGPLFIDKPIVSQIYKEFGLDPDLLECPHEFNLDEWGKHMREKSETEKKLT